MTSTRPPALTNTSLPPPLDTRTRRYDVFEGEADEGRKRGYLARNVLPRVHASVQATGTKRVIEIGPGRGLLQVMLREDGVAGEAFEVCEPFARALTERGYACTFAEDIPLALEALPAGSVAACVAIDVLEHLSLEDGTRLLRAFARVLHPQGRCIVQVPNAAGLFGLGTFAADPTHVMLYSEHSLPKVFAAAGFAQTDVFPLLLPATPADALRSFARVFVFAAVRFLQRLTGANPARVLTHNLVAEARRV